MNLTPTSLAATIDHIADDVHHDHLNLPLNHQPLESDQLDAAFINLEQPNTPQHVGGLGIYDPSTAPGGSVRFKDVIAGFERRLGALPIFRTRLVEVPGGLDRPYWVKDANFDVEFHLRHIALPEPGDWRQLCIQVARLHSRPPKFEQANHNTCQCFSGLPPVIYAISKSGSSRECS